MNLAGVVLELPRDGARRLGGRREGETKFTCDGSATRSDIQAERFRGGLTLREISARTGLSEFRLAQLERGLGGDLPRADFERLLAVYRGDVAA